MVVKKAPSAASGGTTPVYEKELEYLYARRTAIDELIQSLQEYDLSKVRWDNLCRRQTA